jgi:ABC-type nitrate/sulfonate/bicarbonate transport system permease component
VVLAFGVGHSASVALVIIGSFPAIFTAIYEAMTRTPDHWLKLSHTLGLSPQKILWKIQIPLGLPQFFTGLRGALSMGWMSVIASELVAGDAGLGYLIQLHRINLDYDLIVIDMVFIGFLGFAIVRIVDWCEKRYCPWIGKGST